MRLKTKERICWLPVLIGAVLALSWTPQAMAADCNSNGIDDATEIGFQGFVGEYYNNNGASAWTTPLGANAPAASLGTFVARRLDAPDVNGYLAGNGVDGRITPPAGTYNGVVIRWRGYITIPDGTNGWFKGDSLISDRDSRAAVYINDVLFRSGGYSSSDAGNHFIAVGFGIEVLWKNQVVLGGRDSSVHAVRAIHFFVQVELFDRALHQGLLVIIIKNNEIRVEREQVRLAAQDPRTNGMKRTQPDSFEILIEELLYPRFHLSRGFIGERNSKNMVRAHAQVVDHISNAVGQHTCFPGSRPG